LRQGARAQSAWLLCLCVLLISATFHATARGEPAAPLGAPVKTLAVSSARLAAEEALLSVAAQTMAEAESLALIGESALLAARSRALLAQRAGTYDDRNLTALSVRSVSRLSPTATPQPHAGGTRVPILMYHHVAKAPPEADAIRLDLSVDPAAFAQQMDWLLRNGYQAISLADLSEHLLAGHPLPGKPVVLTFDDGYDDNYSQAFAILRHRGLSGTFFIITDVVGQPGYMTWQQIAEMTRADMLTAAHGRTHTDLALSGPESTTWQVTGSRTILEEKTGRPVRFYCYPSGRYTAQTISILRAQGYIGAVSTAYGATHTVATLFELKRVRIRGADTLEQFVSKLETAP